MNSHSMITFALVGATSTLLGVGSANLFNEQPPSETPEDIQRMMEKWMATIHPGEQHEFLGRLVGEWETQTTIMGMGPAQVTKGKATITSVLGGRFTMTEEEGTMMGMEKSSISFMGYDVFKKKFITSHMSTLSTAMLTGEGTLDQTGRVLTFFGQMDEPMTDQHDRTVKYSFNIVNDDKVIFEIHDMGIVPGNTKVIETIYTRAD